MSKTQLKLIKFKRSIICLVIVLLITLSVEFSPAKVLAAEDIATESSDIYSDYLKAVMDMIKGSYVEEVEEDQLLEGALKGMLGSMDPYTSYYTRSEADVFFSDVEGTYQGIGVVIEKKNEYVFISKVFPGSPAEKSGLLQGDIIVTVNGENVTGMSVEEVAGIIKGEVGTKVTIGILRGNDSKIRNFDVERMSIKINPVTYEIIGDIGYIKIEIFNANTSEFLKAALKEIDAKGIKKIILDLRDNPGGLVDQCVAVAQHFVPKGLITKLEFRSQQLADQEYYSYLQKPKYKLAVLINGMSASASEIVAGAIQDTGAGTIIGTKSYGKAKVQSMLPILSPQAYKKYSDQVGLKSVNAYDLLINYNINPLDSEVIGWTKITTGMYLTPKGNMIDGIGITPDIEVEDTELVQGIDVRNIQKLTKTWKPTLGDEGYDVYNAEKILKVLGYDVDEPDTVLDEKTFKAVWKFRTDKGLYPGGVLDFTTQDYLNKELDNIIMTYDKQYAKAIEILMGS